MTFSGDALTPLPCRWIRALFFGLGLGLHRPRPRRPRLTSFRKTELADLGSPCGCSLESFIHLRFTLLCAWLLIRALSPTRAANPAAPFRSRFLKFQESQQGY